jgi:ribose 5-phosphate isomerase A
MGATEQKRQAGQHAALQVESGMTVGLGTGSTAAFVVEALGRRVREEGLRMVGVCTSTATERLAAEHGVPTAALSRDRRIDLYIDGADEVTSDGVMIKGGGGALLREKMVADWARRHLIVVDESKLVERLGVAFRLPVEIIRFGHETVVAKLAGLGCETRVRAGADGTPFLTDEGHHIVDCRFPQGIANPLAMQARLRTVVGLVETGLFIGYCNALVIGHDHGAELRLIS